MKYLLTLILGRAGTGKTAFVMNEIKRKVEACEEGTLLIVPEQYSHYAERQLCAVCGDELSLYAETVSFSRLCINVLAQTGNAGLRSLDTTGQILAVNKALEIVNRNLKVYGKEKRTRVETLKKLLEALREFRNLNISVNTLKTAEKQVSNPLKDKLHDLILIYDTFNNLLLEHGGDTTQRISLLAERIAESSAGFDGQHIYIDGFNDFTVQEINVIEELLKKNANVTICLTCDLNEESDIFKIPQKTVTQLQHLATTLGIKAIIESKDSNACKDTAIDQTRSPELTFLEKYLFTEYINNSDCPVYKGKNNAITIYSAPSRYTECEYAAYEILKLVRSGYRWRDIGVMSRDWDEYGSLCENVFERYGIPVFTSGKVDILCKPPITVIDAALEITAWGMEHRSVFKYLKTGLIDISIEECAMLENYVLKWQIRGNSWYREWKMSPKGYSLRDESDNLLLEKINLIRERVVSPLKTLCDGFKRESTSGEKLKKLYNFLEEIKLPERLVEKAKTLVENNELRLADEYTQLWEITLKAMDQMHSILKNDLFNAIEFHKLFILALSQNNVGVIPVSIDRTALGDMAMSRRRDLKCLILLGATDENMPNIIKSNGMLSENERIELNEKVKDLPAGLNERLYREMNMLYSTLTQPSEKLVIMYPLGEKQRPSFIISRLCYMFGETEKTVEQEEYMVSARIPYEELRNSKEKRSVGLAGAFMTRQHEQLSAAAAQKLYGKDLSLSATRVGAYYSCPYSFFMKYGLKLQTRNIVEYDGLAAGNFIHDILESVIRNIKDSKGFTDIDVESCLKTANGFIKEYEKTVLLDFDNNENKRLEFLFRRYSGNVEYIIRDTINEINNSYFKPLDPELDMKELSGELIGRIDRVDGYEHDGRLYIRVIDYKTHKSAYSLDLSDVLYGRNMQMLMYLFALEKHGYNLYKKSMAPAGVLYVPTRDVVLNVKRDKKDDSEAIERLRINDMRRSGLIINDPDVINAMEINETKTYLPKMEDSDGVLTGDSLISREQFTLLSDHVTDKLQSAEENILNGDNICRPYYNGEQDNGCSYCEYKPICNFDETNGDMRYNTIKKKPNEVWQILEKKHHENAFKSN